MVVAAVVVGVMLANRQVELPSVTPANTVATMEEPPLPPPAPLLPPQTSETPSKPAKLNSAVSKPPPVKQPPSPTPPTPQPARAKKKPELRDPVAREALALVGMDPEAEAYWLNAIYDTSLPDGEREDLMEDLNEDGLSDPKRPGPQDLPLILNRLAIIEEVAPYTDDFMLRHLGEAYKDLVNLAAIMQGGGEPVR